MAIRYVDIEPEDGKKPKAPKPAPVPVAPPAEEPPADSTAVKPKRKRR